MMSKKVNHQIKDATLRIESLMNPDKEVVRDQIKLMGFIDKHSSGNKYTRIKSIDAFKAANSEGQKYHV